MSASTHCGALGRDQLLTWKQQWKAGSEAEGPQVSSQSQPRAGTPESS